MVVELEGEIGRRELERRRMRAAIEVIRRDEGPMIERQLRQAWELLELIREGRQVMVKAPPGPPPRPGLEFDEQARRWKRPDRGSARNQLGTTSGTMPERVADRRERVRARGAADAEARAGERGALQSSPVGSAQQEIQAIASAEGVSPRVAEHIRELHKIDYPGRAATGITSGQFQGLQTRWAKFFNDRSKTARGVRRAVYDMFGAVASGKADPGALQQVLEDADEYLQSDAGRRSQARMNARLS